MFEEVFFIFRYSFVIFMPLVAKHSEFWIFGIFLRHSSFC